MKALPDLRTVPAVSVVVPTCRRPRLLHRCLAALATQTLDRARYEVVVADDEPNAATRGIVEDWAARTGALPRIRYVAVAGRHGPAAARNAGCRAARAPLIAFTDDDTVPSHKWLAEGLRALGPDAAAAVGHVIVPLPEQPTDHELDAAGLDGAEFTTANCFLRKADWAAVGGFDEDFTMAWREDSDLQFSLLERGRPIVEAPAAVVTHPVRPAGRGESLRRHARMRFDALLFRKHPRLYRERIRRAPRWDYYGIVAALLLALGGAAAGQPALAFAAGLAWVVLTARLVAERRRRSSRRPADVAEVVATSIAIPPLAAFWRLAGAIRYRTPFA